MKLARMFVAASPFRSIAPLPRAEAVTEGVDLRDMTLDLNMGDQPNWPVTAAQPFPLILI